MKWEWGKITDAWRPSGKGGFEVVEASGPVFSAFVYMEMPEETYDKRVIFAAYVQTKQDWCNAPTDCDGQVGGSEFDMIETGFVGFNDTQVIDDNFRCDQSESWSVDGHSGCASSKCGSSGCNTGYCAYGDDKNCNWAKTREEMPSRCTWTDVQQSVSFCTQQSRLDPTKQDFTQFSSNGYATGHSGPQTWSFEKHDGVSAQNGGTAWGVHSPDEQRFGNRWIKLDLSLQGDTAVYDYTFYEPSEPSNTRAKVAGRQQLKLTSRSGETLFRDLPHVWVFSLWQYDFWGAVSTRQVPDGIRKFHYVVLSGGGSGPEVSNSKALRR